MTVDEQDETEEQTLVSAVEIADALGVAVPLGPNAAVASMRGAVQLCRDVSSLRLVRYCVQFWLIPLGIRGDDDD